MNDRVLLDTNAVIAIFSGDAALAKKLAEVPDAFVPAVVLGELYHGASRSAEVEANAARIDEFAESAPILRADATTAWHYGNVKGALRAAGRLIPENDIWIAALARQYDLAVLTRDEHFQDIADVRVETW